LVRNVIPAVSKTLQVREGMISRYITIFDMQESDTRIDRILMECVIAMCWWIITFKGCLVVNFKIAETHIDIGLLLSC